MSELRLGIAGLGTVGAQVVSLLARHADGQIGIAAVSARSGKDRGLGLPPQTWRESPVSLASDPAVDVVVELMGGADGAAYDLARAALQNGKPLVTANKALLAMHGEELFALSAKTGTPILFEAAVAGGIPVIKILREGLAANSIEAIHGILNGTCNYILSEMSATGRNFADVLAEARDKGYAEADPSFDIDGHDTAHKLALLAMLAFGGTPDVASIHVRGIRDVQPLDIRFARELGFCIKLLGTAKRTPAGIEQSVEPCLVPESCSLAAVSGVLNAVYIDADHAGKILLTGAGAGGRATASAVVADIIELARGRALPSPDASAKIRTADISGRMGAYYLRLMVTDRPGVIADISAVLRDEAVSLESVLQHGRDPGGPVPVVMTTHETGEDSMARAVTGIAKLASVVEPPYLMRIDRIGWRCAAIPARHGGDRACRRTARQINRRPAPHGVRHRTAKAGAARQPSVGRARAENQNRRPRPLHRPANDQPRGRTIQLRRRHHSGWHGT